MRILQFSERFERIVSNLLLAFGMLVLSYQLVQLIWNTVESFGRRFRDVGINYSSEYGHRVTIEFFNILLTMEILQTIKVFPHEHIVKVRVILIVCLIAVSRKVLALNENASEPLSELALAGMILALSLGYFMVSRVASKPVP